MPVSSRNGSRIMVTWQDEYTELLETFPRLDDSWFVRKLQFAKAGDDNARLTIIGSSLWIAWESANEFEGLSPMGLPELTQEANAALVDAVETFYGEDAKGYEEHVRSAVRDRLLNRILCCPAGVE